VLKISAKNLWRAISAAWRRKAKSENISIGCHNALEENICAAKGEDESRRRRRKQKK